MINLDSPWKIVVLVATIALLRVVYSVWKSAPYRLGMLELLDSGLIAFALVFFIIRPFVVQAFYIPSASMEPTLLGHDKGKIVNTRPDLTYTDTVHDRILVNKFIYRLRLPERQDIVVFRAPQHPFPAGGRTWNRASRFCDSGACGRQSRARGVAR